VPFMRANVWLRGLWGFGLAIALIAVFVTPYCGLLFQCGCRPLWAGAAQFCNINHGAPPYCPFCNHGVYGYWIVRLALLGSEFLALTLALQRKRSWLALTGIALGVFVVVGAVTAGFFAIHDGYCFPFTSCWWRYYRM